MQDSSASSQPVPPPKPSSAVTAGSTAEPASSSSVTLIPRSRSPAARRLVSFPLRNTSRNPRPDMSRIEDSIVNVYEASDAVWLDPWNARYSQSIAVNPGAEIHELDLDSESNDERVAVEHRRRKLEGHIEEAADLSWSAIPGAAVLRPPPRGPTVAATISSRPDSFTPANADSSATAEEPPKKARTLYQPISKGDPRGIRPQLPTTPKVRLLSRDQVEASAPAGEHQAVSVERTPEQEQPRESREDKPSRPPPVSKAGQAQATFDEQGKASSFPDPKSVGTPTSPPKRAPPGSGESSSVPPRKNPPDPRQWKLHHLQPQAVPRDLQKSLFAKLRLVQSRLQSSWQKTGLLPICPSIHGGGGRPQKRVNGPSHKSRIRQDRTGALREQINSQSFLRKPLTLSRKSQAQPHQGQELACSPQGPLGTHHSSTVLESHHQSRPPGISPDAGTHMMIQCRPSMIGNCVPRTPCNRSSRNGNFELR